MFKKNVNNRLKKIYGLFGIRVELKNPRKRAFSVWAFQNFKHFLCKS
jgi:hypothetical protein